MLNTPQATTESPRTHGSAMNTFGSAKARILAIATALGVSATACVNPPNVSGGAPLDGYSSEVGGTQDGGSGFPVYEAGNRAPDLGTFPQPAVDVGQPAVDTGSTDTGVVAADSNKGKYTPDTAIPPGCESNPNVQNVGKKVKAGEKSNPADPNQECTIVMKPATDQTDPCGIKCVASGN